MSNHPSKSIEIVLSLSTVLSSCHAGFYLEVRLRYSSDQKTVLQYVLVNKQDLLQVFKGARIGKIGDNLTSADPLSYTTNGSGVDPGSLVSVSCVHNPTPSCWAPDQKHWTDRKVSSRMFTLRSSNFNVK